MPTRRKRPEVTEEVEAAIEEDVAEAAAEEVTVNLRSGVVSLRAEALGHSKMGDRLSWADVKDLLDQLLNLPD